MKALKYKVQISVSPVHRHLDRTIQEIWIPELEACLNEEKYVFRSDEPRANPEECQKIDVPNEMYESILAYLENKEVVESFCERIFLTDLE